MDAHPKNTSFDTRHDCDVLVLGAGVSGYCAAIQAGRCGCRTILVEKDEVLGGNSGPNLGVGITGADRYHAFATEPGIIHEIHEEAGWRQAFTQVSRGTMPYNISRRFEGVVQEYLARAGVTVLKRHYAREPVVDEQRRIVAVVCEDLAAFRTVRIDVEHVVIEASGDGEIAAKAGAEFTVGSEARPDFGERSAPEHASRFVQGTSLVALAHRTDREVVFVPPPDLPPYRPRTWNSRIGSFVHHHTGMFAGNDLVFLYVTETGGDRDTIRDDGAIYEDLLRQLWAEWDHLKNGPHRDETRNWDLLWVSPRAGKRESRRFLGDVILTQTHLEAGRFWPDDIAWGGHDLDDHRPAHGSADIFGHSIPPVYGIPLGACYSRNVPNLLLAGRLVSATHLAHSSIRVMRTGGAIGQGVGYAAVLCCRRNCSPATVREQHLRELREGLLTVDGAVPKRVLRLTGDLAPRARVTATSELRFNDQRPGGLVPLLARAGVMLWDWQSPLRDVSFFLRNTSGARQRMEVRVYRTRRERKWRTPHEYHRFGGNDLRDEMWTEAAVTTAELPGNFAGWWTVQFPEPVVLGQKDPTDDDDRVLIALNENPVVEWALDDRACELMELVEHSHHADEWQSVRTQATLRLNPAPLLGEAVAVVNGFKERYSRGPTNMWMSNPDDGLPQDLVLEWDTPQTFDRVTVIFDNLAARREEYPWEHGPRALPQLVKTYSLDAWRGDAWERIAGDECNYHRFRRHDFPQATTRKLRLRVTATHGSRQARVYEVRVLRKA